jgi:hypothetical protein
MWPGFPSDSLDLGVVHSHLAQATSKTALALGLTRVLTLLPLHDPALEEVERYLADAWNALLDLRRILEEQQTLSEPPGARTP